MKSSNEYAQAFGRLYARIPKSVFAAVALSYANFIDGSEAKTLDAAVNRFLEEWQILNDNGVVPQKPAKRRIAFIERGADVQNHVRATPS